MDQNRCGGWLRRVVWEGPSRPALQLFHPGLRRRHFQELLKLTALLHTCSGRLYFTDRCVAAGVREHSAVRVCAWSCPSPEHAGLLCSTRAPGLFALLGTLQILPPVTESSQGTPVLVHLPIFGNTVISVIRREMVRAVFCDTLP